MTRLFFPLLLSSAAALLLSSSSLWLLLLSLPWHCVAQLLPELTDEAEVLLNPKFHRGYGEIREGSYIISLSSSEAVQVAEVVKSLINETLADQEGVVRAILQHAFRGFHWTEPSKERRYAVLKRLLASSLVEYIEEDQKVGFVQSGNGESSITSNGNTTGNDQICPPWGIDRIDQIESPVNGVYHYDWTGSSVDAYVLDTGIRETHEQFEGRATCAISMVVGEDCEDGNGHGTHCAGTIGGRDYGVAKQINVIGVKVLGNDGAGYMTGILRGMDYVVYRRAITGRNSIMSLSLGGIGASIATDRAVQNAFNSGVFVVVAAGNNDMNACFFSPASSQFALTVGSVDKDDWRSSFSNHGPCVDVFAPGDFISSSWNLDDSSYNTISGTSMAGPHAAGAAALFWDQSPDLSTTQLMFLLKNSGPAGTVVNARGPQDSIVSTRRTFLTVPGTKPALTVCPLPPPPIITIPTLPPDSPRCTPSSSAAAAASIVTTATRLTMFLTTLQLVLSAIIY